MISPILAIDTSTQACSVALALEDKVIELHELADKKHTQRILLMIDELISQHSKEPALLAFGCGPGSFTGLRIACSVVQGLALAWNKPVVPVSTLRAIAQGAYRQQGYEKVVARLDARMQEWYWGVFELDASGLMQPVTKEQVGSLESIEVPEGFIDVSGEPRAYDIAFIAQREPQAKAIDDIAPVYLRNSVAKKME